MKKISLVCLLLVTLLGCFILFVCTDTVGQKEFECPVCKESTAYVIKMGVCSIKMKMKCGKCGMISGYFSSFNSSTKDWPLVIKENKEKIK